MNFWVQSDKFTVLTHYISILVQQIALCLFLAPNKKIGIPTLKGSTAALIIATFLAQRPDWSFIAQDWIYLINVLMGIGMLFGLQHIDQNSISLKENKSKSILDIFSKNSALFSLVGEKTKIVFQNQEFLPKKIKVSSELENFKLSENLENKFLGSISDFEIRNDFD